MSDSADDQRRKVAAEKSVVADLLARVVGFFGHAGLPRDMQAALNAAGPSPQGHRGPDALAMPLAGCVDPVEPGGLVVALEQVWPFRHLVGILFSGKEGRRLTQRIRKRIRERLLASGQPDKSDLIAERQIRLLRDWLTNGQTDTCKTMAARLHAETRKLL